MKDNDNDNQNSKTKNFKRPRNKSNKHKKVNKYFRKKFKIPILNPDNIKDIITNSFISICQEDTFCVFKSVNGSVFLIYKICEQFNDHSIIIYNIVDKKVMVKIKNPHKYSIGRFKHIFDDLYNRDLFISYYDHNIKLWDINKMENLFNKEGFSPIQNACFLNENKIIYILIKFEFCPIVIYDLKGEYIKQINDSKDESVFYFDSYYDKELKKNFIIAGDKGYTKSYDFHKGELYHIYEDNVKENDFYLGRPKVLINKKKIIQN